MYKGKTFADILCINNNQPSRFKEDDKSHSGYRCSYRFDSYLIFSLVLAILNHFQTTVFSKSLIIVILFSAMVSLQTSLQLYCRGESSPKLWIGVVSIVQPRISATKQWSIASRVKVVKKRSSITTIVLNVLVRARKRWYIQCAIDRLQNAN